MLPIDISKPAAGTQTNGVRKNFTIDDNDERVFSMCMARAGNSYRMGSPQVSGCGYEVKFSNVALQITLVLSMGKEKSDVLPPLPGISLEHSILRSLADQTDFLESISALS